MDAYNGEKNEDERESQTKHQEILLSYLTFVYKQNKNDDRFNI